MERQPEVVIVDTSASPHAEWQGIGINRVKFADSIWEPRRRTTVDSTLRSQYQLLEDTGRLANFRRTAGKESGGFASTFYFDDSDVYKWIEAAAWAMATDPDDELDRLIDSVVQELADAQQPDGYLDNWYTLQDVGLRWTELVRTHELYCAGHLIQAAVAHVRATGKTNLLEVALKFADLICDTFGPVGSGKRQGTDGHEEIELALVELGRLTGELKYIEQAGYFLDARGQGLSGGDEYHQDHVPFRAATDVVGHAVRQVYLTAGATDIYTETGDDTIKAALDRLWRSMVTRRMYVSSGIGSRYEGEAFGVDFELPNRRAYTESCAAIGSAMWNWRMLLLNGERQYADLMEATFYNAMLPGLSLSGDRYFYQNPLEDDGTHRREPWFDCACCPPNLARTLASIGGYIGTVRNDEIALQLYARGTIATPLPSGAIAHLTIDTDYPWDGAIRITIEQSSTFTLSLRVPGWATGVAARVNGEEIAVGSNEYISITRSWNAGDVVELNIPMAIRNVTSHPYVTENLGRIAVFRGPILYCMEAEQGMSVDPRSATLVEPASWNARHDAGLLGGVTAIDVLAVDAHLPDVWSDALYRNVADVPAGAIGNPEQARLIPYFVWANREPGPMSVWLKSH